MEKIKEENRITVASLIRQLQAYPMDHEVYFSGLEFYRLKDRGPYVQVEFSELVSRDSETGLVTITNLTSEE